MVKSTVTIRFDDFAEKIMDEANRMVDRLKKNSKNNENIHVTQEMIRFVACTSARCFIGMELDDEFYDTLMKFTELLNNIVVATYFLPRALLRLLLSRRLKGYRNIILRKIEPENEKYRNDPTKSDSLLFRKCVDYVDKNTGEILSNKQIGEIVVCLLYVSSENTALGLAATITDLATNQKQWDAVAQESKKYMNNVKSLFSSQLLDACVMESARMNSHIFPIQRRPISKEACIGEYYVGDVNSIAMCQPLMMVYECSEFSKGEEYNPNRFLDPINEPKSAKDVMSWGAGVHLCPGKMFAIYEIKAAMAVITNNFKMKIEKYGKINYFSPSAFAERECTAQLIELTDDEKALIIPNDELKGASLEVPVSTPMGKTYTIQYFHNTEADGTVNGAWLLKNMLNRDEQVQWYKYTYDLSKNSKEQAELASQQTSDKTAFPLTFDNLVYTGSSNCEEPTKWYVWAQETWDILVDNADKIKFPKMLGSSKGSTAELGPSKNFDSFYSQLFPQNGTMVAHKDEYVDWGVSVSFGSSCMFKFGDHNIVLNSGDVLVADFSKTMHAVDKICVGTEPGWWKNENNEVADAADMVETFGKSRCSVQIRDISKVLPHKYMEMDQFKNMLTGN
jgi:cytochrome P450/alkylated DNA repair dioxygenase AlkB